MVVTYIEDVVSTVGTLALIFLKVPQIMHIRENKSVKGIYFQAMLMEILSFSILSLYNFTHNYSFWTYIEYPIIILQIFVLLYYTLKYKKMLSSPAVPLGTMTYVSLVAVFALGIFPKEPLAYMVVFCTPLSGFAKVIYIYGIIRAENGDAVSLTTWNISIFANFAHLFTEYLNSGDSMLMINILMSAFLSYGVLLSAMWYQSYPGHVRRRRRSHNHRCRKTPLCP